MDWQMPGMDELQTAEKIKAALEKKTPLIIMVPAYAREKLAQKVNGLEFKSCLIKPVSPSILSDSIMEALGEKTAQRPFGHKKEQFPDVTQIQGAKFLVVEDNEVNQQVAKGILEKNGFVVDLAANGLLALEAVQKTKYDAVLMDINMPEMDGCTATRKIREQPEFKDLPIIAMTANAMAGDREKTLAAGMNDYVPKPINVKKLLHVLRTLVTTPASNKTARGSKTPPHKDVDHNAVSENFGPLPGINIREGLVRMAGNMLLYRNLLKKFAENQADTADKIRQALISKEMETAQRLAHSVKGVSGNISATLVFESATRLDDALKNRDMQAAMDLLPDFSARLSDVIQGINGLETGKA
ncbi:MAG: response regulator, partial [Desulfobacterales bacterium]|nr:response regulator [Desulfobacterales bacterium]